MTGAFFVSGKESHECIWSCKRKGYFQTSGRSLYDDVNYILKTIDESNFKKNKLLINLPDDKRKKRRKTDLFLCTCEAWLWENQSHASIFDFSQYSWLSVLSLHIGCEERVGVLLFKISNYNVFCGGAKWIIWH